MSFGDRTLDPALREVALELEERDRGSLFQTPPTRLLAGMRDGSALLRVGGLGQSAAMDQLLAAHREELAWALFHEAEQALGGLELGPWRFHPGASGTDAAERPAASVAELLALSTPGLGDVGVELGDWAAAGTGPGIDAIQAMFAASVRLVGRESARLDWGLSMLFSARPETRRRALSEQLRGTHSHVIAGHAAHGLGVQAWARGEFAAAREWFERAFEHLPALVSSAVFAEAMAWCAGAQAAQGEGVLGPWVAGADDDAVDRALDDVLRIVRSQGGVAGLTATLQRTEHRTSGLSARLLARIDHENDR